MKSFVLLTLIAFVIPLFGCSDDYTSGPTEWEIEFGESFDAYFALEPTFRGCAPGLPEASGLCPCPTGGVSWEPGDSTSTFNDCTDDDGHSFSGTATFGALLPAYSLSTFAKCSDYLGPAPNECPSDFEFEVTCGGATLVCTYGGWDGEGCLIFGC